MDQCTSQNHTHQNSIKYSPSQNRHEMWIIIETTIALQGNLTETTLNNGIVDRGRDSKCKVLEQLEILFVMDTHILK